MFKKGDKVRCIDVEEDFGKYLVYNKIYTVTRDQIGLDSVQVGVYNPNNSGEFSFCPERFVLVDKEEYSLTF